MSSGTIHATASIAAGVGLVAVGHYDLTPAAMVASALVGGMGPDIDRGTSLAGGLIPQWLAPDRPLGEGRHGRQLGPFVLRHHGPTHSVVVGALLALPLALLSWRVGLAFYVCWSLHLLLDGRCQLLWPWPRWYGGFGRG